MYEDMNQRWISVKQCSSYLSIHLKTTYVLISRGVIPAARIGGNIRVDRIKLDKIMEESSRNNDVTEGKIQDWIY